VSSPNVAAEGCQIVILGNFNPAIFSAGWFLANELISAQDADSVQPQAGFPQLSVFEAGWLRCEVTTERLLVGTGEALQYEGLRDVAAGILDILRHTPIHALGINYTYHVAMPDRRSWHKVGDIFAPKEAWEEDLILPGMKDVTVLGVRPDLFSGNINVTLQPSATVKWGFFLAHNDHYNLKMVGHQPTSRDDFEDEENVEGGKPPQASADLIPIAQEILSEQWSDSRERADRIVYSIWTKATQR
jgi:hypothetical protein